MELWEYLESYKHSRVSLCDGVFFPPSSIEGPINNICLAWLPAWPPCCRRGATKKIKAEVLVWGLTSSSSPLYLLTNQRRRQVNCKGERGLFGVLDDYAGFTDVLGYNILVFCYGLQRRNQLSNRRPDYSGHKCEISCWWQIENTLNLVVALCLIKLFLFILTLWDLMFQLTTVVRNLDQDISSYRIILCTAESYSHLELRNKVFRHFLQQIDVRFLLTEEHQL